MTLTRYDYPLIAKLEGITKFTPEERRALRDLPLRVVEVREDQDIVREGDRPSQCCLVLEGFVARFKAHREGQAPDLRLPHAWRHS
jgi:hypothetical protein